MASAKAKDGQKDMPHPSCQNHFQEDLTPCAPPTAETPDEQGHLNFFIATAHSKVCGS
jgi:hypothetical protein